MVQAFKATRLRDIRCGANFGCIILVLVALRRTYDNDRDVLECFIGFHNLEHFPAIDPGNIQVKEDKIGAGMKHRIRELVALIQEVHCLLAVSGNKEQTWNTMLLQDVLREPQMFRVILDNQYVDLVLHRMRIYKNFSEKQYERINKKNIQALSRDKELLASHLTYPYFLTQEYPKT